MILTAKGHDTVQEALILWEQAQTRVVAGLGEARWRTMLADLSAVVTLARES